MREGWGRRASYLCKVVCFSVIFVKLPLKLDFLSESGASMLFVKLPLQLGFFFLSESGESEQSL